MPGLHAPQPPAIEGEAPLATHDGVRTRPMRILAPGFGAGAAAGWVIMRVDPTVVAVA